MEIYTIHPVGNCGEKERKISKLCYFIEIDVSLIEKWDDESITEWNKKILNGVELWICWPQFFSPIFFLDKERAGNKFYYDENKLFYPYKNFRINFIKFKYYWNSLNDDAIIKDGKPHELFWYSALDQPWHGRWHGYMNQKQTLLTFSCLGCSLKDGLCLFDLWSSHNFLSKNVVKCFYMQY